MNKFFTIIFIIVAISFLTGADSFCSNAEILKTVKLEHFKVTTDAEGKWYYSFKVTNTGKKFCNNVFYIKILKDDELFEEHTLSKLLQGSTNAAYQTSNSVTMEKFIKFRVKETTFKCILLYENTNLEDAKKKSEFKTVQIENNKNKVVVDSFGINAKTYTAVLKNNSQYILDIGIVALELCNGNMNYKDSSFEIIRPEKTVTITKPRGGKEEGCTGVLLKLIDHNSKTGSNILFSKTFQYDQ